MLMRGRTETEMWRRRRLCGLYWPTRKAFVALHRNLNTVKDCGPKCTCGDCVMKRLRKRGKLVRR